MPKVNAYLYMPSFKVGKMHNFVVEGKKFSEDDGSGAGTTKPIQALLVDPDGAFDWTPNPTVTLLTDRRIQIRAQATPHAVADPHAPRPGGIGDLTITVTNGDGKSAPPVTQQVFYDVSADT